ncbi:MAG: hypothetical protein V7746_23485 [Halioglobus sp.]
MVSSLLLVSVIAGCSSIGPTVYESSFHDYNDAIRRTSDAQMLTNLVRLRYFDTPVFLQVSSVNASFNVGANAGASAGKVEGGPADYGLNLGGSVSESPTISFSLPESGKYYGRLLSPLSTKQVTSLVLGGFDTEMVFLTAVRGVNGLRNISAEYEDTPEENASFSDYKEALSLIKKLRGQGLLDMELAGKQTDYSSPVTINQSTELSKVLLLASTMYANVNNFELVKYNNDLWQAHQFYKIMAMRFAPASKDSPDAQRLKQLLNLEKDRYNFPMEEAELVNAEKPRGVYGKPPGALDPSVVWSELGIRGRSMMEIMQVASKKVQIPADDAARGVAIMDANQGSARDSGFVIRSSNDEPDHSLRIKYRGHWFYIEDADLESKELFALLNALFAVVGGTVPGAAPVMTIPVGL